MAEPAAEPQKGEAAEPEDVAEELTVDLIASGLKGLGKTVDGNGFALSHLELPGKKIGDLQPLAKYTHLRYLSMPDNYITSLAPLADMKYLLSLDMSKNKLESVELPAYAFLQILNLSGNKLKAVQGLTMPMLRHLNMSDNELETVTGLQDNNTALEVLELHNNQLTSCEGLGVPSLKAISLRGNKLERVAGLATMVNVTELDLSKNSISVLEGLPVEGKLVKLTLKTNQIAEYDKLKALSEIKITEIDLSENPIADAGFDRVKVLRRIPALEILNLSPVLPEEKSKAAEEEVPAAEEAAAQP